MGKQVIAPEDAESMKDWLANNGISYEMAAAARVHEVADEGAFWTPPAVTGNRTLDAGKAGGEYIFHELRRLWMSAPGAFAGVNEKADHEAAFDRYFKLI